MTYSGALLIFANLSFREAMRQRAPRQVHFEQIDASLNIPRSSNRHFGEVLHLIHFAHSTLAEGGLILPWFDVHQIVDNY
jgi:hypothetical protein